MQPQPIKSDPDICLNDQGGQCMDLSYGVTGTLRASMENHSPIIMGSQQAGAAIDDEVCPTITASAGMSGNNQPLLFDGHSQDARYNGPLQVVPTISAAYGEGGNNTALCLCGNIMNRKEMNGGNGIGIQADKAYTRTATDHHAVFSMQRTDSYKEDSVTCTQAARQHKDATDLLLDPLEQVQTIRRLLPVECERLQGFPDGWTKVKGCSDAARYKALGNSVAVPCVEYILRGFVNYVNLEKERREGAALSNL